MELAVRNDDATGGYDRKLNARTLAQLPDYHETELHPAH
jgi:hypothetical protein